MKVTHAIQQKISSNITNVVQTEKKKLKFKPQSRVIQKNLFTL